MTEEQIEQRARGLIIGACAYCNVTPPPGHSLVAPFSLNSEPWIVAMQAVKAALSTQYQAIDNSMVLVPREPTEAMRQVGADNLFASSQDDWGEEAAIVYRAMLAASNPTSATDGEGVPTEEFMSVSITRDGVVTSHNAFDANFDEMVEATQKIIASLNDRYNNRLKCPFASGKALRASTPSPTDLDKAVAEEREAGRIDLGENVWTRLASSAFGDFVAVPVAIFAGAARSWRWTLSVAPRSDHAAEMYEPLERLFCPPSDVSDILAAIRQPVAKDGEEWR